jgi:GT2 family glycosyltransferase
LPATIITEAREPQIVYSRLDKKTKVSLVITTLGRREQLVRCLETLRSQSYPAEEIIVVDQNEPGWLDDALVPFRAPLLPLRVIRSPRGAALGRNYGVAVATGDILGFPDDDCWYSPHVIGNVVDWFAARPKANFLSTRITDASGRSVVQPWPTRSVPHTPYTIWRCCSLAALFVRHSAFSAIGGFDPALGVGAASGMEGAEEADLGLRLMAAGYVGWFEPSIAIMHAADAPKSSPGMANRALRYGRGIGWALAKNRVPFSQRARFFLRPFAGAVLAMLRGDLATCRYHRAALRGRNEGWGSYWRNQR